MADRQSTNRQCRANADSRAIVSILLPQWYRARSIPKDKLPPWDSGDRREQRRLSDWTVTQLDLILETEFTRHQKHAMPTARFAARLSALLEARAIESAECGDVEPLQTLYPRLARFLAPPKRPKGSHFPRPRDVVGSMQCAADDVRRIRAIWKHHYRTFRRRRGQEPTAEGIAAARWGITDAADKPAADRVASYMKSRAHAKARRSL
jgi:hypothetical protein